MVYNGSASAAWQSGRFEKEGRREASIFFFKSGVFDMTADAEPLYRSPTVGRIAIQRFRIPAVAG